MNYTPNLRKRLSRVFVVIAMAMSPVLFFTTSAYALPDTWSSGIVVSADTIATTSSITFTVTNSGSHNYALWEIQSNMTLASNNCGLCVGSIGYTAGQVVTITVNGSPLLAPGFAVTGIVLMEGCGTVAAYYPSSMSGLAAGQAVCGGTPSVATNSGSPTPYCSSSSFISPAGSWVLDSGSTTSGTVSVRFGWIIAPPSAGWTVEYPGDGSGMIQNMGVGSTVDGSPNTYYGSWSGVTAHTPLTATIIAPTISGVPGCQVTFTLSTNQITSTPPVPPDTGSDTQTSTNTNCGFSLNPFHYLKCLFEPSHSLQQWSDLKTTAQSRPPMSIIIGGITYVSDAYSFFNGANASGGVCVTGGDCLGGNASNVPFEDPTFNGAQDTDASNNGSQAAHRLDLITSMGNLVQNNGWGAAGYWIISAGIWIYGLLQIWERIASSFGSKSS